MHRTDRVRSRILRSEPFRAVTCWAYGRRGSSDAGRRRVLLFYPERPNKLAVISSVCREREYEITVYPWRSFDAVLRWEDTTWAGADRLVLGLARLGPVINLNCTDISKSRVDEVSRQVFGYGVIVAPRSDEGPIACKTDRNAKHDGQVMIGPIHQVEEGRVYTRLIDNETREGMAQDLRVPVTGGRIPFVYKKLRPIATRFSNKNASARIMEVGDAFSPDETDKILAFCDALELDIGELDVLRDRQTSRIHVIDVANTPYGPPNGIAPEEGKQAVKRLADAFRTWLDEIDARAP